ncbi:IMP dehydrogenase [Sphingobium sp. HWE2-09]|uniref:IMP dehydrogenase n=1 Tax=Sphingobium sp. HWE2-09 TaxID=3108390 RepID=UPI002DD2BDDF|nr:IMP dehydrogenase [Sphingobium sp. HWE2-09]
MAQIILDPSRTFGEFLLLPNLTTRDCLPANVDLSVPVARVVCDMSNLSRLPAKATLSLNIPFASAMMQSVTDDRLAIELARCGGIGFIYGSQAIEAQAAMVRRVKLHKAGFVESDANVPPTATLEDVLACIEETGHSTVAITSGGSPHGVLLGMVTRRDYRPGHTPLEMPVNELMTSIEQIICARQPLSLKQANDIISQNKLDWLPILDGEGRLQHLVFRKDYELHNAYPLENVDAAKRLIVGAAINTRDYRDRIPALVSAGADVLCIDSSDGYSHWQAETLAFARQTYGESVSVGAGNVVDGEAFRYLVEAGASFVKVGVGGGSICITREQKGIGRGQASALQDVVAARAQYYAETGVYVPICSDGGISQDYHVNIALALGADFVMLGRYFARFEESPGRRIQIRNRLVKEYWGEGSNRARNWDRYADGGTETSKNEMFLFEEGVDSYVPYAGSLRQGLDITLGKIRSTLCSCGSIDVVEFHRKARLTLVSSASLREGGVHDVIVKADDADAVE